MATVLDGKALAQKIEIELAVRIRRLKERSRNGGPILATILVGSDPSSATYVKMKGAACRRVGMDSLPVILPEETTQEELLERIDALNVEPRVHGILLQHPLPAHIGERECFDRISLTKDVDGVTALGFGRMAFQEPAFGAATPIGIMALLHEYRVSLEGKHAVVVGRSPILGKPMAMMLLNANATVTVCHSKTEHLPELLGSADIVVGAVGKPHFIKGEWIKKDAVVIDAGYHPGGVGDIDLISAIDRISAYTPVPGGVGPMTIASLIARTVNAAEIVEGTPSTHRVRS